MEKLDEVQIKELANTIVDNIFEEMSMMSMGGSTASSATTMATPSVETGNTNGSGDVGGGGNNTSNTDTSKNTADTSKSLDNISTKLSSLSSKSLNSQRGPHTGIVKNGNSFSLQSVVRSVNGAFPGSRLQTDGLDKLAGSGVTAEKIN